ncbi:YwdI family protein [Metabacillus sp. GX 13764]|uniref:YwdI family protein n=1 Tax=Metabacillus kandeliae TaxID=2900151 RepID=UPI001E30273F|nr:YwdI family protein [Metabacillus kandeliae]MCD7034740.1 YwdI family protein [Metabacillus kandeliae]
MEIPIQALLLKMEEELKKAKSAGEDKAVRDHLLIIRSLCDVAIDAGQSTRETIQYPQTQPSKSEQQVSSWELQKMMGSTKKPGEQASKDEDEANGDSIFDF